MADGDPKIGEKDWWDGGEICLSTLQDLKPTLYHYIESYFSQIVRLVLAEEGLPYQSRILNVSSASENLEPWYIKANPMAAVPVLVHKGVAYAESRDISLLIVETLSEGQVLLGDAETHAKAKDLFDRHYKECEVEKATMSSVVHSSYVLGFVLPWKLNQNITRLEKMKTSRPEIVDILDRKIAQYKERLKLYDDPKPKIDAAIGKMQGFLDTLETNLTESEFVCGAKYSLADCVCTCLLARLIMIGLLWDQLKDRPKLTEYWERVQKRSSFKTAEIFSEAMSLKRMAQNFCTIL